MSTSGTSLPGQGRGAHAEEPAEGSRGVIERELKRAGRVAASSEDESDRGSRAGRTTRSATPKPPQTSEPAEGSRETIEHELARQPASTKSGSGQSGYGSRSSTTGSGVSPSTGSGGVNDGEHNPVTGGLP
jgi:hypothetical protein